MNGVIFVVMPIDDVADEVFGSGGADELEVFPLEAKIEFFFSFADGGFVPELSSGNVAAGGDIPEIGPEFFVGGAELKQDFLVIRANDKNHDGFMPKPFSMTFTTSGGLVSIGAVRG